MQQNSDAERDYYRPVHLSVIILFVTIGILGILAAVFSVRWVVIAGLLGIGLGTLLIPLAEGGHRRFKIPRTATAIFSLILFFGVFFFVGYALIQMISDQIVPELRNLPHIIEGFQAKYFHFAQTHPGFGQGVGQVRNNLGGNIDLQKYFGGAAGALFSGLKVGADLAGGLIFIFFIALYLAIRPDEYVKGFVSMFPEHLRPKTREVMTESAHSLRQWFWAQLTAMAVVAVVAAIALKIVSSPYWLFFGGIAFVLELIPYFGPLTALATVCVVTLAANPDAFIKTAIAFSIVLFLEGNVIIPVIMRGRVKMPPIHLLVMMSVLGTWFGVFGFLMAAPTLAVIRTIYQRAYLPKMDRQTAPPGQPGIEQPGQGSIQPAA